MNSALIKLKERLRNERECALAKLTEKRLEIGIKRLLELVQKITKRQSRYVCVKRNHPKINQYETENRAKVNKETEKSV